MRRSCIGSLFLLLIIAAVAGWFLRSEVKTWWQDVGAPVLVIGELQNQPDPERYTVLKEEAERWRQDFAKRYRAANSEAAKQVVIGDARIFLETVLPDLMACWLGTPWDFHGTSETPGEGSIACGYFVATLLRDAGFKVHRYRLAKQPSQNILRTFLPRSELSLRVGVPYETYAGELRTMDSGIRIVGLDTHVGFIVSESGSFRFVHASGSEPWCVVDESEEEAVVLQRSNYRVQGSLTANSKVIRKWLLGEKFLVHGR